MRGEGQAVTNTKSINREATDSVRAAVQREDEKMERRQCRPCKVVMGPSTLPPCEGRGMGAEGKWTNNKDRARHTEKREERNV